MADEQLVAATSRAFAAHPDEVAEVRHFVEDCAEAWGIDSTDVVLIASELATNAVLHGHSDFIVTMRRDRHVVRLEVSDRDSRVVTPLARSSEATSGRGLALVVALADEWGVQSRHDGKCVWTEIRLRAG
jgi:anti-sigma regulatory factor (Ser/Thr protein kinase)